MAKKNNYSAKYEFTFREWRNLVSVELRKHGCLDTKEAFFWYLHDYTDLLTYRLKLSGGFTSVNRDKFMQYSWKELYRIISH